MLPLTALILCLLFAFAGLASPATAQEAPSRMNVPAGEGRGNPPARSGRAAPGAMGGANTVAFTAADQKGRPPAKGQVATVPVPVVATTPNEGVTYGGLVAFLISDQSDQVTSLVAPQFNHNQNFGYTGTLYGAFYPNPDRQLEINLSQSTIINQGYDARLRDKTLCGKKVELNGYTGLFADGSARFFGFQSESLRKNQTNYTDAETGFNFSVGYDIIKHVQLAVGERFRDVSIRRGAINGLPFIRNLFTTEEVPGIEGFTAHAQRIALIYDSMDSRITPRRGFTEGRFSRRRARRSGRAPATITTKSRRRDTSPSWKQDT
jgi:hypothetical protein